MLSSGMFARHQPPAPALRRGRALYVDPRSFPEKSLLCFHTLALSFIFRIQHFSLQALCFQSLPHSFQKRGVGINSSQSGTRHSALIPLQLIQVLSFHTFAHSLAQWAQHNPFGINSFRTLSIAMGVEGYFFRIRKAMRTPRSAAPRGLSNFVSGISSRVHSDFRFRLPPSAPCACLPNVLHSP